MDYKLKKKRGGKVHVHYDCPHCAEVLSSELSEAGSNDVCPRCKLSFVVPGTPERERLVVKRQKRRLERALGKTGREKATRRAARENQKRPIQRSAPFAKMVGQMKAWATNRRNIIAMGLGLVCLTGLFPPTTLVRARSGDNLYAAGPRTFLLWPPNELERNYSRIDYQRLHTEWLVIAAGIAALVLVGLPAASAPPANSRSEVLGDCPDPATAAKVEKPPVKSDAKHAKTEDNAAPLKPKPEPMSKVVRADMLDLAIIAGADGLRIGIKGANAVGDIVSKVEAELNHTLTAAEHQSVTEAATRFASQTPEQFEKNIADMLAQLQAEPDLPADGEATLPNPASDTIVEDGTTLGST